MKLWSGALLHLALLPVFAANSLARPTPSAKLGIEPVEDEKLLALTSNRRLRFVDTPTKLPALKLSRHDNDASHKVWSSVAMATIAGASTVLGACVILFMPEDGPPPSAMAFSFSLAAGVMLAISIEMLMPHDHGEKSDGISSLLIFCGGAICTAMLCKLGDIVAGTKSEKTEQDPESLTEQDAKNFRLAVLLFVSLTLHNFPEGFAVAISAHHGMKLGVTMCVAVACHNIPEGIALAVSVYRTTKSYGQAFLWTFISGLTEPLGAICAMTLLHTYMASSPELLHHLLVAVAGVMCYVAIVEILPEAVSTKCWGSIFAGFMAGMAVMILTHMVMDSAMGSGHVQHQLQHE